MALIAISGGNFQDAEGNALAGGSLILQLNNDAVVLGTGQVVSKLPLVITLDENGNAPSTDIWFNDQLSPSGTVYIATLFSASSQPVWSAAQNWSFTGGSPINLNTMVPTVSSVTYVSPQVLGITISGVPTAGEVLVSTGTNSAGWQTGIPATFLQLVSISATAPAAGDVLTATSATAAQWQVPAYAPVTSVFGRVGAVIAASGDYSVSQITGAAPAASPTFTGTATIANMSISGTLTDVTSSVGTSGQVLSSTGTGVEWVNSVTSVGLSGTSGQITVTGTTPITSTGSWTLSLPNAVTLGVASSAAGSLILAQTNGFATTIIGAATANWTLKLPTTAGTNTYVLTTDGSGNTYWAAQTGGSGMTWPAAAGIAVYAGSSAWGTSLTAPASAIVGVSDTQTLTNKTVDGVSPTIFGYLTTISSNVQTQLNALAPSASPTFTGTADFTNISVSGTTSFVAGSIAFAALSGAAPSASPTFTGTASFANISVSGTTSFASNAISLSAVAGAAPLASPTFTGTVNAAALTLSGVLTLEANGAGLVDASGSAGADGDVLAINSSGYPVWTAGGGSAYPITISAASFSTTAGAFEMGYSGAASSALGDGTNARLVPMTLYKGMEFSSIGGTTSFASVLGSATVSHGSLTLVANQQVVGSTIHIHAHGTIALSSVAQTITFQSVLKGVSMGTQAVSSCPTTVTSWEYDCYIYCSAVGAASTAAMYSTSVLKIYDTGTVAVYTLAPTATHTTSTVATTGTQSLDLQMESSANSDSTIQCLYCEATIY
jgi:hypothetical protein